MLLPALQEIFKRDIARLKEEISAYADEDVLWATAPGISNSAGNLCLHLVGNLNHFIGSILGDTGYIRERDKEFSDKNIPRAILIQRLDDTLNVVLSTLGKMTERDLEKVFPLEKWDREITTEYMLLHLLTHFHYHLGQINYHRRLLAV